MKIQENYSLQNNHTFHIPVKARYFVTYDSVAELQAFLTDSDLVKDYALFHIGSGSNLLFLKDYNGVILHSEIRFIDKISEDEHSVLLRVGSGVVWDDFVTFSTSSGWWGAENLSHIPGEVGASAVQNIGAYGVEAKDIIESVEAIDIQSGKMRVFSNFECNYGYRESIFKTTLQGQFIITAVVYRLQKASTPHLEYGNLREMVAIVDNLTPDLVRRAVITIRDSKLPDPAVLGNAGSFFKNPVISRIQYDGLKNKYPDMPYYPIDDIHVKVPAGWLIDRAGWKGYVHKGAGVYEKQSLVLVNRGTAQAQDIVELSDMICRSIQELYGIKIYPEVNFI